MPDFKNIVSPALFAYPQHKTENGTDYELSHFVQTENGFAPVYVECETISNDEALNIILGGDS